MKKHIVLSIALCLISLCLTSCGDAPEAEDTAPMTVTLYGGKEVNVIDDNSTLTETAAGYQWTFHNGDCTLTLPLSWASRILIRDTTVYSRACFERGEPTSSIFSIEFRTADQIASVPVPAFLLGICDKNYICAVYPRGGDPQNGVLRREYRELRNDCPDIFNHAVCHTQERTAPFSTENYIPATEFTKSPLFGTWNLQTSQNGKLNEQVIFNKDNSFMLLSDDSALLGCYLCNIYVPTYDMSTNNWGDAAVVFLDGGIYLATYTEGSPRTLEFSTVQAPPGQSDPFKGTVYALTY